MATTPFRFLQRRTSTSGRTPEIESLLSGELYLQLADETIYFRNDKNELVAVITDGDKFSLDKIKFTGASSGDIAVWNGSKFTPYGIANLAANLDTGVLSSVFASINHNHAQYVSTGSTGSFITTSMTGAFGGGGGNVDLSSYITTGQTGDFVTTSQTGAFAPTGSYVVASQTGNFLTNNDTGIFANVFAPTGDYVEIIDNRVPAQYLPSYVDDILEFGSIQDFCTQSGSPNNIYVISGCNSFWRWGSSQYVEIFASPGTSDSIPEGINNLYFTNERSACYVLKTQTGNFIKDSQTGIFANIFAPNGNYALASQTGNFVTKSQTGNFIHTSMICAFSGGSGVDLTNYVSVSQTGDLINVFAPTGDYVTASQTGAFASIGNYVTTSQTGDFITSSQTGAFAPTGDYVLANQTGNFIVSSQTGEFAPTGNYVEIIDGRVPAQYLPSYVDNVLEFGNIQDFCNQCGNVNNIYVISGCSSFWRWGSSQYVEIFASPGTSDSVPEGINNLYFTNQRSTCYVAKTQTGCFVTAAQTGTLTSVFAATGNYVFNSQTGILTNAFAPTGNYVQTVCGQIPAQYLPSYVDEITGSACVQNFCNQNGNPNYIYTVSGCNSFWRWDGSKYVEIFASPGTSDSVAEGINNLYFTTQRSACYVAKTETGSFITTSMTGAFAVGGEYVTVSQTGDLTGAFAPSGSYVTTSQTGQFAPSGSYVTTSQTGQFAPSGNYATIVDGLVPAQYLPAYVDQILEFGSIQDFCTQNGNSNYIYVISGCNSFWRWGSSQYVEIFASPGTSDSVPEGINNLYFTNQRSACYVAKTQTGCFITAAQTGTLTNVFAATGNYVLNSQTGILTTAFAPTGNYVQTVCGQVPAQYLPSYVDEIVGFACVQDFCNQNGNSNYVYIVSGCNSFWRWGGSQYVEIFASPGTSDSVAEGINNLYFTAERSACYVSTGQTGSFITTSMTGAFAVGGEYVTASQTGELTGAFASTGDYVTTSQTGAFAPTGDYVVASATGSFVTTSQTGAFAPTGDYVVASATGSFVTTSQTGSFASINGGYLLSSQIPTITGDVCIIAGSNNALICKIQGYPVSNAAPINGQTLQFNGTSWVPGDIPAGGNGGGGLIYYFNNSVAPDSPTANLPASISGTFELGRSGVSNQLAIQKTNLLTSFESIVGFVTDVLDPSVEAIPAGLFDFNIWASSNSPTDVLFQIKVYKYDGSNSPTLLATSNDVYTYDDAAVSQYAASVILPQTTLSTNDRLYVELLARALNNNHSITFYFGGNTPSHIHTTVPSVGGSGLVKVINGVTQSRASLITNSDISGSAAIDASKIQSGVFALCSETGRFETTGYARNCYVTTGQTGVYETTDYARNCYVNTGQTGQYVWTGSTGNFITTSQTGVYETTGYARNCYVTTGQTGALVSQSPLSVTSGVKTLYEELTVCDTGAGGNLINFDIITNSTMYYVRNSTGNFYINLRGNSTTSLNSFLPLNNSLSVSFIHRNVGPIVYSLTGVNIDGTSRTVNWAGGQGVPTGIINATNVYSITAFKTGNNLFSVFGSLGFFV